MDNANTGLSGNTALSVTAVNNRIKELVESDASLGGVYVRGELSNYKTYPSGHHYFTLKDKESAIRCVMFRGNASKLRFRPENGMGVIAFGDVSVYVRDGAYQLYCKSLAPDGVGDLHVAFEQLKARLMAEGLFDERHKKPLPRFPARIAVITSEAGAAVRDVIRILGERWPLTKVIILPVRVQGEEAPAEIAGAIRYANRHGVADLIITGRGGGSIEDLWAFNDERVARAIFDSVIPVISAVGHEPDVTISDYVADLRASTPSNAAELAVPDMGEMRGIVRGYEAMLERSAGKLFTAKRSALESLRASRVMQSPTAYIDLRRMELDFVRNALAMASERCVSGKRRAFTGLAASLDALSPLKVLTRGYCVAADSDGSLVRDVSDVEIGDRLDLRLGSGTLGCLVERKTF